MASPIDMRMASVAASPAGFLAPAGVADLIVALQGKASEFAQWAQNPMTVRVRSALQDMVLHPPVQLDTNDRLVQYGMSQGLLAALQLLTDPSMLWPGAFGPGTNGQVPSVPPPMDFGTSLDDAIYPSGVPVER